MSLVDVYRACGLNSEPSAILWDLDGTITDTESQWVANTKKIIEARGGSWLKSDEEALHGSSTEDHAEHMEFVLRRDGGDVADGMVLFEEVAVLMAAPVVVYAALVGETNRKLRRVPCGASAAGIPEV